MCTQKLSYDCADNTTLLVTNKDEKVLMESVQAAQQKACDWFSSNKLLAHPDKTHLLIHGLSQTQSVKLLWNVHFDSKLNWRGHINYISKTLSRISFLIRKQGCFNTDQYFLRMSYVGLFQSHLSYGLVDWAHSPSVHQTY